MNLRSLRALRGLSSLAAACALGVLVAGCGGGAGSSALPTKPLSPTSAFKPKIYPVMHISRSSVKVAMAKLTRSGAYFSPIKGGKPIRIHTKTVSAGMDLTNNGGPVVPTASVYNILVNCPDESCWGGDISGFENSFFSSDMIHILDQYVGQSATYTVGGDIPVTYNTSNQLGDQDIVNIIYNVAQQYGTGYNAVYNVFLENGVQQCSQNAGGCYLQQYCAYHGSNDYSDIGHTLYTVEPYQDVSGCQVSSVSNGGQSPNGSTIDSTASTLSHELSETFTDPDVAVNNLAWYNSSGGEIGDLCAPAAGVPTQQISLNGTVFEIQGEYDNNVSDCSWQSP